MNLTKLVLGVSALGLSLAFALLPLSSASSAPTAITVAVDQPGARISRNLYGQFVEHLGRGVYEGIWVGEDSSIPNTRGIRNDVVAALKKLNVPGVRWPGGCFADIYHWRDGIGPRKGRPQSTNTSWANLTETNAFGTHEFMDFVEQIGAAPYVSVNMGTGTPAEGKAWMDYMTAPAGSSAAAEREKNGRSEPWQVPFVGVGNESWGCGGSMRASFYADQFRLYQTYLSGFSKEKPMFIATGPDTDDYLWTDVVMSKAMNWREKPAPMLYDDPKPLMGGLSLHYYTLNGLDWHNKGRAVAFTEADWISTLNRSLTMDELIRKHSEIMDRYDPQKTVALVVDEWGTWYQGEKDSPSQLYQQNTLRDALVAGVTLNIFQNHADRVRMANIAQMINVLQAMILTKKDKILLTPTYHVFEMYKVHQNATALPVRFVSPTYSYNGIEVPALSVSASKDAAGIIHISVVNLDPHNSASVSLDLEGVTTKHVGGQFVTAEKINSYNDFDGKDMFVPQPFTAGRIRGGVVEAEFAPKSVTVMELR